MFRYQGSSEGKESHHIFPKCLGGTNDKANRVKLPFREHFFAHQLLLKMFPKHRGLLYAAFMMSKRRTVNSRGYSWVKTKQSESVRKTCIFKNFVKTEAHKKAIGDANRGKTWTMGEIQKKAIGDANRGKKHKKHRISFVCCLRCRLKFSTGEFTKHGRPRRDGGTKCLKN